VHYQLPILHTGNWNFALHLAGMRKANMEQKWWGKMFTLVGILNPGFYMDSPVNYHAGCNK